ncbi:MAG: hypothetical protein KIT13_02760 [Burkholderiales bacterium]|nr:hypothetical protein [Burkholderiales bacterium]
MVRDPQSFTAAQRAAILAEWKRIAGEPPPRDPRPWGCLAVIAGIVLFFALPRLGFSLPPPWGTVLLAVIGLLVAAGAFVGIFMGSGRHGRAAVRAEAALEALTGGGTTDETARMRHAVALIAHAAVGDGPTLSHTLDLAQAKRRLGANLDYVIAVEEVLAQEQGPGALRIFTGPGA